MTAIITAWLATASLQCSAGEPVMLVVEANDTGACTRVPIVAICGTPHQLAQTVDSEARTVDCAGLAEGAVRVVDTATAYPHSVVGYVQRDAVTVGGETLPALAPYWGVCQGAGCRCASAQCEHIPVGGPNSVADDPPYYCVRLRRLFPEATCP